MGYIASLWAYLKEDAAGTEEYWNGEGLERFHFIGKDIQYFHAATWFWAGDAVKAGVEGSRRSWRFTGF